MVIRNLRCATVTSSDLESLALAYHAASTSWPGLSFPLSGRGDRGRPVAPERVGEASTDSPCVRLVLRSRMVRLEWILNSGNPSRHPVPERRRRGEVK